MLQRAASNAYSWWWAGHIRTKQTKWLEQSLQDMEEKVQFILSLIEDDGDSFAKRAEMYYKRRPELISSVEETYKAFKALADRYDILSKELQNANHTIATVFPEQVQFGVGEDDDYPASKDAMSPPLPGMNTPSNVPEVPKAPYKELKRIISAASKQFQSKKPSRAVKIEVKSGLTKEEALEEINKLQKDILAMQTVKEFVKSSYESGLAKYWEIENQIMEMQQRVSELQDEFNMGALIEDDEARTLMAQAALKSCQETLAMLQDKQDKATREAREEYKRIEAACQRLQFLREKYLLEQMGSEGDKNVNAGAQSSTEHLISETKGIEPLSDKTIESLDLSSITSLTVTQMAEKIDQLVNKIINLETAVSSQTVLVNTLRTETDDLNTQIQNLEDEKANLVDDTQNLSTRVKEMEEKLTKIQDLNKNVECQHSNLQTNFSEARTNLDHLSEKLSNVKPDETEELEDHEDVLSLDEDTEDVKEVDIHVHSSEEEPVEKEFRTSGSFLLYRKPRDDNVDDSADAEAQEDAESDEDLHWQEMLLSEMDNREKLLLREYTTILKKYKELKNKVSDMEKQERDIKFDMTLQMRDLKIAIFKKDEENQYLRQRLNSLLQDKDINTSPLSNALAGTEVSDAKEGANDIPTTSGDDEAKLIYIDRIPSLSKVEGKLRMEIDSILDENLDFWLRFSTSFHQVRKFRTEVQDLQDETSKLKEKRKADGSYTAQIKSDVRAIYKHLREIQTELSVWLDQSVSLKDELKCRFASLCSIQEEITKALREGAEEDEIRFSSHQAAKFQGEILNMKQENNKVREELQAALDHVRMLQLEIQKTLRQLNEEFGIASEQADSSSRPRVPLRSFIFGTKKKQKNSILSYMHPNRRYQKGGVRKTNR